MGNVAMGKEHFWLGSALARVLVTFGDEFWASYCPRLCLWQALLGQESLQMFCKPDGSLPLWYNSMDSGGDHS